MAKRHYKVDELLKSLTAEEREAYEQMLRDATCTADAALAWWLERGFEIGRSSVARHKRNFEEVLSDTRRSAEMAKAFTQVAEESDLAKQSEVNVARFQSLLMRKLMEMGEGDDLSPKEWSDLARAVTSGVQSTGLVQELRAQLAQRDMAAKKAVAEAEKAAKDGVSGPQLVDRVRQVLGLPG